MAIDLRLSHEPPDAAAWLTHHLRTHGPTPVRDVLAAARVADVGEGRLRKAARDIGAVATRGHHTATWALAADSDSVPYSRVQSHEPHQKGIPA